MPKDAPIDKPALKSLQKLEEKVLDANLNISAVGLYTLPILLFYPYCFVILLNFGLFDYVETIFASITTISFC